MNCASIWSTVRERLVTKLDSDTYQRYLAGVVPLSFDSVKGVITLGVLNDFVALWLDSNYKEIVVEVLDEILARKIDIKFEPGHDIALESPAADNTKKQGGKQRVARDSAEKQELFCRPDFTFDTFVVGNNNRICHAAALAVTKNREKRITRFSYTGASG